MGSTGGTGRAKAAFDHRQWALVLAEFTAARDALEREVTGRWKPFCANGAMILNVRMTTATGRA
jgi:hypothetical protein